MRRAALALSILIAAASARATAVSAQPVAAEDLRPASRRPGREISLPSSEVKDSFFAYVIGILAAGIAVDVDREEMRGILTEFKAVLDLPFDLITRVTQTPASDAGDAAISLDFTEDARIPIPFSLLGYHPGSIRTSRTLGFCVHRSEYPDLRDPARAAPIFILAVCDGFLRVDVDEWLDVLLGDLMDDMQIRSLVFFTYRGEWTCLLEGTGNKGQSMREYFNFKRNWILFPAARELDELGRRMLGLPEEPAGPAAPKAYAR